MSPKAHAGACEGALFSVPPEFGHRRVQPWANGGRLRKQVVVKNIKIHKRRVKSSTEDPEHNQPTNQPRSSFPFRGLPSPAWGLRSVEVNTWIPRAPFWKDLNSMDSWYFFHPYVLQVGKTWKNDGKNPEKPGKTWKNLEKTWEKLISAAVALAPLHDAKSLP